MEIKSYMYIHFFKGIICNYIFVAVIAVAATITAIAGEEEEEEKKNYFLC